MYKGFQGDFDLTESLGAFESMSDAQIAERPRPPVEYRQDAASLRFLIAPRQLTQTCTKAWLENKKLVVWRSVPEEMILHGEFFMYSVNEEIIIPYQRN